MPSWNRRAIRCYEKAGFVISGDEYEMTTPSGKEVAMVHGNNCTNDMNKWVSVLNETLKLFGKEVTANELYTKLYEKALEGDADCGGVLVCNYMAGEGVTHLDEGRPLVLRRPDSKFTLANFLRASLYATMSTLKIGMDILAKEQVAIDSLTGHGGLFKTPVVGQKYMAAACNAPVTCMETAGEGGPYGMALLAAYRIWKEEDGKILCKMGDQGEIDGEEIDPWQVVGPDENGMLTFGMLGFVKE